MSGDERWCLIESDPGIFTNMVRGFGARGIQVDEIYTLDQNQWDETSPTYALIFLFKYGSFQEHGAITNEKNVFFARQVVPNACASYALLNVLLNLKHPDVELGSTLEEIREFCKNLDGYCSGEVIANTPLIKLIHNSSAQQALFEFQKYERTQADGGVFHYVGYVPVDGVVYELDGLKTGPVVIGETDKVEKWVDLVLPVIKSHIDCANSIRFNLMAIVPDKIQFLEKQMDELWSIRRGGFEINNRMCDLERLISEELEKRLRYEEECIRRQHNYLPLVMEVLKLLGRQGKLVSLYEKAKERFSKKL